MNEEIVVPSDLGIQVGNLVATFERASFLVVIGTRITSERRGAREYWREKRKEMNKIKQSEARPFAFFAGM